MSLIKIKIMDRGVDLGIEFEKRLIPGFSVVALYVTDRDHKKTKLRLLSAL